jgi:hypothetical protein
MHSFSSILFIAALFAALVLSTPTPTVQKRSFKHVVRRSINRRHPASGPNAMVKAYRKYGFQLLGAKANTTAPSAQESGTVAAVPEPNAAEYLSTISVGGQSLTMDFDTGSSDL